jgi:hypothetical protein
LFAFYDLRNASLGSINADSLTIRDEGKLQLGNVEYEVGKAGILVRNQAMVFANVPGRIAKLCHQTLEVGGVW